MKFAVSLAALAVVLSVTSASNAYAYTCTGDEPCGIPALVAEPAPQPGDQRAQVDNSGEGGATVRNSGRGRGAQNPTENAQGRAARVNPPVVVEEELREYAPVVAEPLSEYDPENEPVPAAPADGL